MDNCHTEMPQQRAYSKVMAPKPGNCSNDILPLGAGVAGAVSNNLRLLNPTFARLTGTDVPQTENVVILHKFFEK